MRHSNVFHTGSGKNTYKLRGGVRVEVFVVEGKGEGWTPGAGRSQSWRAW